MFKCQCGCGQQSISGKKQFTTVLQQRPKTYWNDGGKQTQGFETVRELKVLEYHTIGYPITHSDK